MEKENQNIVNVEKKRPRVDLSNYGDMKNIPHLNSIQIESFQNFIKNKKNSHTDLHQILKKYFPIYSNSYKLKLEYIKYWLDKPFFNTDECKLKGLTFSVPVVLTVHMCDNVKSITYRKPVVTMLQDVFFLYIPIMTENGTFIINGTERIIVSQIHKAPGIFFDIDKTKTALTGKKFYYSRVIPQRGSWLDIEFDMKDAMYARIEKKKKFPVTMLLKALGMSNEEILHTFYKVECISYYDEKLLEYIMASDVRDYSGHVVIQANTKITEHLLSIIKSNDFEFLNIIDTNSKHFKPYISNTINVDITEFPSDAIVIIYTALKSMDPISNESAKFFFDNLFFSNLKYNLSQIGRIKINERFKKKTETDTFLHLEDIIEMIKILINIKEKKDKTDDIDNLNYRRIRGVGEILGNFFKLGLFRADRFMKDKLSLAEIENVTPQEIINAKALSTMLREFFCSSPLSQFMDQTNPLAEITHKRRISSLGPGGLNRERAGFEVREVHNSHYGRLCPIETPEGQNIGLINSLAIYAKTDKFGFLQTPYLKVNNSKITDKLVYFLPFGEEKFMIAQSNVKFDKKTKEIINKNVSCRFNNEFSDVSTDKIQYIDISPKQISSAAAALIPFLEHNDANRALMGSNMQKQAVPLLIAEKPLIGTGIERIIGMHSCNPIVAKNSGTVIKADGLKIIVKLKNNKKKSFDIYNLIKYKKSNQNTCINQKPLVFSGDKIYKNDVLADGSSTDLGEIALGHNLLTAFMTWNGYNFEDSIILSESTLKDNKLSSIHLEEHLCFIRELKSGTEETTINIPNIKPELIKNLDESGIIRIGSDIKEGDILVGKITKKTDLYLSPEEKLLQAIFGEKLSDSIDSSLKAPIGTNGKVIDIQILIRSNFGKDNKRIEIEEDRLKNLITDINYEYLALREKVLTKIEKLINKYNKDKFNIDFNEIIKLDIKNIADQNNIYIKKIINYKKILHNIDEDHSKNISNIKYKVADYDDLSPGVNKLIKILIASKKSIQIGDKLSGRHGNKGVVSTIVPIENMPYLSDGTTIEIVLNPLGIPSRMNIGQLFETHLGLAAKYLGKKIKLMKKNSNKNDIKNFINNIYNFKNKDFDIHSYSDNELEELIKNLENGVPLSTPIFDGVNEKEMKYLLKLSGFSESGKVTLYDGKTGMPFNDEIAIGYQYIMKLNHLVDDKIHARSTGSYSIVTQQPLGGKAQFGGQRFGEMEVWALEAYGAAYTLLEMLTIKSDDMQGRIKLYKNIIDANPNIYFGIPEAFNVLVKELIASGLNIELEND